MTSPMLLGGAAATPTVPTIAGPNAYRAAGALRINTQADVDGGGTAEGTIERTVGDQFVLGSGVINWSHRGDFGFLMHMGIPLLRSNGAAQPAGGSQACIGLGVYGGNGLLVDVYEAGYGINITQIANPTGANNGYGMLVTGANSTANGAKPLVRLATLVAGAPNPLEIVTGVGPVNPSAGTLMTEWKSTFAGVGGISVGAVYADTGILQWNKDVLPTRLAVAAPLTGAIAAVAAWGTVEKLRVGTPTVVDNLATATINTAAVGDRGLIIQLKLSATGQAFCVQDSTGANLVAIAASGALTLNGGGIGMNTGTLTMANGVNIAAGTGSGMKIGTATTQKIGFYNVTPVAQQTGVAVTAGGIHAALVALGLFTA